MNIKVSDVKRMKQNKQQVCFPFVYTFCFYDFN